MSTLAKPATEWYRCSRCKTSFLVKGEDPNLHLLKKSMRCPNYESCKWRVIRRSSSGAQTIPNARWISAVELFQATSGIGLREERKCSIPEIKKVIIGARIIDIHLEPSPDSNRSILLSMTLDTNKIVHFATSIKGPVIYKMTEA